MTTTAITASIRQGSSRPSHPKCLLGTNSIRRVAVWYCQLVVDVPHAHNVGKMVGCVSLTRTDVFDDCEGALHQDAAKTVGETFAATTRGHCQQPGSLRKAASFQHPSIHPKKAQLHQRNDHDHPCQRVCGRVDRCLSLSEAGARRTPTQGTSTEKMVPVQQA